MSLAAKEQLEMQLNSSYFPLISGINLYTPPHPSPRPLWDSQTPWTLSSHPSTITPPTHQPPLSITWKLNGGNINQSDAGDAPQPSQRLAPPRRPTSCSVAIFNWQICQLCINLCKLPRAYLVPEVASGIAPIPSSRSGSRPCRGNDS